MQRINDDYSIRRSSKNNGFTVVLPHGRGEVSLSGILAKDAEAIVQALNLSTGNRSNNIGAIRNHFTNALGVPCSYPSVSLAAGCVSSSVVPPAPTCACPGCKAVVKDGRQYCSKTHNFLEFLRKESTSGHTTRSILAYIFLVEQIGKYQDTVNGVKGVNHLQPEITQYLASFVDWAFTSNHAILDVYGPHLDIFGSVLGRKVDGTDNIKVQDQMIRVRFFVDELFNPSIHKIIRILDGHGFLLLYILARIRAKFGDAIVDQLTIEFVDKNSNVNAWHKKMFNCPSWKFLEEDILLTHSFSAKVKAEADTRLTYFNFCGVAASYEKMIDYFRDSPHFRTCLVSFSQARAVAEKDYENSLKAYSGHHKGHANRWKVEKVPTPRKGFATYKIIKTN
eukprot:gene3832-4094_t